MGDRKKKINTQQRSRRSDGDVTRAHIFEVAGQIFAEKGYADTTSKEICERAKTNIAAINYHFGSRDQLYLALLEKAHDQYVGENYLNLLDKENLDAQGKLAKMIDDMLARVLADESWYTRLLTRELLDPTPILNKQIYSAAVQKMSILLNILSEITGLPATSKQLLQCVLHVMAPCAILLLTRREVKTPLSALFKAPAQDVADQMKRFIFAGLNAEKQANK